MLRHVATPLTTLTLISLTTACITSRGRQVVPPPPEAPSAAADTDAAKQTPAVVTSKKPEEVSTAPAQPSADDQLAFVRKHSNPQSLFDAEAHRFSASLADHPESGSVGEAALAVGIVRSILEPSTMITSNLGSGEDSTRVIENANLALDTQCQERGLNLADALANNALLQTPGFAKLVLDAMQVRALPGSYKEELLAGLRRVGTSWREVNSDIETSTAAAKPAVDARSSTPEILGPGDLRGSESPLTEAQSLADRGEYKSAIAKMRSLKPGNPGFDQSEMRIREISDQAVRDLRSKAADAFQDARQIGDIATRSSYLKQAKLYLEQALNDYPQASQLATVRENLRMITSELEAVEKRR